MLSPHKLFKKIEIGLELVSLPHSLHKFWRKIFLVLHSINWPNSLSGCLKSVKYWQYVYFNCLLARLWRHKVWIWTYFSDQAVFSAWTKSQDKNLNIWKRRKNTTKKLQWKINKIRGPTLEVPGPSFSVYRQGVPKFIELKCWTFWWNKQRSGTRLPALISAWFWRSVSQIIFF